MNKLFAASALGLLAQTTDLHADRCFGGSAQEFLAVEVGEATGAFCSQMCFTKEYWEDGSGPATLKLFIFAAANGSVSMKNIEKEFDTRFALKRVLEFGTAFIHAYSCIWQSGRLECTNNKPLLCG